MEERTHIRMVLAGWGAVALGAGLFPAALSAAAEPPADVLPPPVVATADSGEPELNLEELVATALRDNARLKAMRAKWEAMRERPVQARTLPNPMVTLGGMDMAAGGRWPNTSEKRYMVEQEFPLPGKRRLRESIAIKDAEAMQRELEAMIRETAMMVKESYFDLAAVQRAAAITRDEEQVLRQLVAVAETMYATGGRSQQDVIKAQAEITMLKQKLLEWQAREAIVKAKLNLLLNRRAETPLGRAAILPRPEPEAEIQAGIDLAGKARPEIKGAEVQIRRTHDERDLMQREFWPDYRLGLEYRTFTEGENMVMLTVGFDLPVWRGKYRAGVREAENMIDSARAELEAVRQQIAFEVQDAHFNLLAARRTLSLYQTELLPQAEARFAASQAAYRTGKADFMDLLESERFQLNARVMVAMTEGMVGMQQARLERAIGADIEAAPAK